MAARLDSARRASRIRGDVVILDRPGLEAASWACFCSDRKTYARVLGQSALASAKGLPGA